VKGPSSIFSSENQRNLGFISLFTVLVASSCLVFLFWLSGAPFGDPYLRAALNLNGSREHGTDLFRMNCVGCHGISGQGLVGPDLRQITFRRSDIKLIKQVLSGDTPPMPSFELNPQEMADLLAHLHTLV